MLEMTPRKNCDFFFCFTVYLGTISVIFRQQGANFEAYVIMIACRFGAWGYGSP